MLPFEVADIDLDTARTKDFDQRAKEKQGLPKSTYILDSDFRPIDLLHKFFFVDLPAHSLWKSG
jgi:hypothetical protein